MQKCVLLILFFLLSYSISHGNTPTTDTLSVDSLESRPAFFKRMYKNVYRYFTEANQEKKPNDSISRLSADRIFRATPNWD